MATTADGDDDGSAFERGSNNGNDAAIADEARHGRTARATAAANETSSGLKRNRVQIKISQVLLAGDLLS